ncbi:MAG: hypothetical protein ABIO86_03325 [Sphingomonas sp.]
MRKKTIGLLAGIAALAMAGTAMATTPPKHVRPVHVLNIALPDGTIQQIRYRGETPPAVVFTPVHRAMLPVALGDPFAMAPFAEFDRIAAAMDRQMDDMLRQVSTMAAQPIGPDGKIDQAAFAKMPAGSVHYSFVSSSSGTCSRSVQVTSFGANQQPIVVSQSSGNCAGIGAPVTPVVGHPDASAKVTQVKHDAAKEPAAKAPSGPTI